MEGFEVRLGSGFYVGTTEVFEDTATGAGPVCVSLSVCVCVCFALSRSLSLCFTHTHTLCIALPLCASFSLKTLVTLGLPSPTR